MNYDSNAVTSPQKSFGRVDLALFRLTHRGIGDGLILYTKHFSASHLTQCSQSQLTVPVGGSYPAIHEKVAAGDEPTVRTHEQSTHSSNLVGSAGAGVVSSIWRYFWIGTVFPSLSGGTTDAKGEVDYIVG